MDLAGTADQPFGELYKASVTGYANAGDFLALWYRRGPGTVQIYNASTFRQFAKHRNDIGLLFQPKPAA